MKIWIVEDNLVTAELHIIRRLENEGIKAKFRCFPSAKVAIYSTGSVDVIIIDVAAMKESLIAAEVVNTCHLDVISLFELHPGATFIIYSGSIRFAKAVYDRIMKRTPLIDCHWTGYFDADKVAKIIRSLE